MKRIRIVESSFDIAKWDWIGLRRSLKFMYGTEDALHTDHKVAAQHVPVAPKRLPWRQRYFRAAAKARHRRHLNKETKEVSHDLSDRYREPARGRCHAKEVDVRRGELVNEEWHTKHEEEYLSRRWWM